MPGELENAIKRIFSQSFTLDDISNTLQDVRKYSPYKRSPFKEKQPIRVEIKDKQREIIAELMKKANCCHNFGSTDQYTQNCPKAKKRFYAIEQLLEEESPKEDSESESMGDAIREHSDDYQDPKEELIVE
ncbi:hypothetical protein O181_008486 [Austropuccinia psidii MF-1]|uniref:Uncharacterized protein n=1 Tax=Austropuccinia psidii MF-1 TaxID=1389203 RepID=A0A9Q3BPY5_9BASI|nr:hypothetical protein [Austropuccinia psidii MF-1]